MSEQEQLERDLQALWQRAANTRKNTSVHRIETIMRESRATIATRDSFQFATFLLMACLQLLLAIIQVGIGQHVTKNKVASQTTSKRTS